MKMKKSIASMVAVLIMAIQLMCPTEVSAATVRQVKDFKQTVTTKSSINMKWRTQSGISGYRIYRSEAYDGKYTEVKTVYPNNGAFCNKNLKSGKEYYYKIRSFIRHGEKYSYGTCSNILTASTKQKNTKTATTKYKVGTRMRKHAGTNYSIVVTIPKNKKVRILTSTKDKKSVSWYKVSYKTGSKTYNGYIRADLL